jgi:hypothetical protein
MISAELERELTLDFLLVPLSTGSLRALTTRDRSRFVNNGSLDRDG